MSEGQKEKLFIQKCFTLDRETLAIITAVANSFKLNDSSALRLIISEWYKYKNLETKIEKRRGR